MLGLTGSHSLPPFARQWRNAAIQEALSEDPIHTERAYDTAVYLFKAILDDTIRDGQLMEEEDRMSVEKCASWQG
jgi:hypothetical protein